MDERNQQDPELPEPTRPTEILPQISQSQVGAGQPYPSSSTEQTVPGSPEAGSPQPPIPLPPEQLGTDAQPTTSSSSAWPAPQPPPQSAPDAAGWQPVQSAWPSSQEYTGQSYPPPQPPPWAAQPTPPPEKRSRAWLAIVIAVLLVAVIAAGAGAFVALRGGKSENKAPEAQATQGDSRAETGGLKITFKSAETRYFKLEVTTQGTMTGRGALADDSGPLSTKMIASADVTFQVLDRLPDGVTRVKMTTSNEQMAMSVNGQQIPMPERQGNTPEMIFRVKPDGTFEMEEGPGSPFYIPGAGPRGPSGGVGTSPFGVMGPAPILPDRPINPGDTWNKDMEVKAPGFSAPVRISTVNTYERDENTQWGRAMLISSRGTATIDLSTMDPSGFGISEGMRFSGTITFNTFTRYWFVPELGEPVKVVLDPSSSMKGSMAATAWSYGTKEPQTLEIGLDMTIGMTLERQVSGTAPGGATTKTPLRS